jgi:hypothetical protein
MVSKTMTYRTVVDYRSLCLAIVDAAYLSKEPESSEEYKDKITRIEKDINSLDTLKGRLKRARVATLYNLDWNPATFSEPLDMIKQGDTVTALEKLDEMTKTLAGIIS